MFESQPYLPPAAPGSATPQVKPKPNRTRILIYAFLVLDLLLAALVVGVGYRAEIAAFASDALGKFQPPVQAVSSPAAASPTPTTTVPTVSKSPTPTVAVPTASPTPPLAYLVWSKDAGLVGVFDQPGGTPKGSLINASLVTPGESKDGWVFITASGITGWIAQKQLYQTLAVLEMRLVNEPGAYLRDDGGAALALLPTNSPVFMLADGPKERDDITWVKVVLLDGRDGWVAQHLLHTR